MKLAMNVDPRMIEGEVGSSGKLLEGESSERIVDIMGVGGD